MRFTVNTFIETYESDVIRDTQPICLKTGYNIIINCYSMCYFKYAHLT